MRKGFPSQVLRENSYGNVLIRTSTYLIFVLLFTVSSGAIRKWVPVNAGVSNIILFGQLLVLPASTLLLRHRQIAVPNGLFALLSCYIIFACNPLNLTLFHGLLGLLIYCGWFIILKVYLANRYCFDTKQLTKFLLIVIGFEFLLAAVQYTSPADSFINKYANQAALGENSGIALVGSAVRVTGTFSYLSGFTAFLIVVPFLCWGLLRKNTFTSIASFLLLACLPVCMMTGSRMAVLIHLVLMTYIILRRNVKINQLIKPGIGVAIFVVISSVINPQVVETVEDVVSKAAVNFGERRNEQKKAGEERQRIFWDWEQLLNFNHSKWLTGVGLGATYQGATSTFGTSNHVQEYGYYETENARIMLETGVFGLLLRFMLGIYISFQIRVPTIDKWFLAFFNIFLFTYVFNVYNAVFGALALILLDNLQPSPKNEPAG